MIFAVCHIPDAIFEKDYVSVTISRTWRQAHVHGVISITVFKVLLKISWSLLPILALPSRCLRRCWYRYLLSLILRQLNSIHFPARGHAGGHCHQPASSMLAHIRYLLSLPFRRSFWLKRLSRAGTWQTTTLASRRGASSPIELHDLPSRT